MTTRSNREFVFQCELYTPTERASIKTNVSPVSFLSSKLERQLELIAGPEDDVGRQTDSSKMPHDLCHRGLIGTLGLELDLDVS